VQYRLLFPIIVATLVSSAGSTFSAEKKSEPSSPEIFLRHGLDEILKVATAQKTTDSVALSKALRPTLEKFFNFEGLTRRAIGMGWRELNPEQQKKAVNLFSEIVIRSYTGKFDPNSKLEMHFSTPMDLGDGKKEVPAVARYQGNAVAVAYRVEHASKGWIIYDVVIEGVSLAGNYRAQFEEIRQKSGGANLLAAMESKLK
jgi:phospholipid transport system substrate-binding protein